MITLRPAGSVSALPSGDAVSTLDEQPIEKSCVAKSARFTSSFLGDRTKGRECHSETAASSAEPCVWPGRKTTPPLYPAILSAPPPRGPNAACCTSASSMTDSDQTTAWVPSKRSTASGISPRWWRRVRTARSHSRRWTPTTHTQPSDVSGRAAGLLRGEARAGSSGISRAGGSACVVDRALIPRCVSLTSLRCSSARPLSLSLSQKLLLVNALPEDGVENMTSSTTCTSRRC